MLIEGFELSRNQIMKKIIYKLFLKNSDKIKWTLFTLFIIIDNYYNINF